MNFKEKPNFFKLKYLKYKIKYINLKKLKGGGKPSTRILKNINLFIDNPDMEPYLNPMWGFILIETSMINNFYKIGFLNILKEESDNNKLIEKKRLFDLVNLLFREIPGEPQVIPIKKIWDNITSKQLGGYIAHRFNYYFNEENNKLRQEIKQLIENKKKCSLDHQVINDSDSPTVENLNVNCINKKNTALQTYLNPGIYRIHLSEKILEFNQEINRLKSILDSKYNDSYQNFLNNFIENIGESKNSDCNIECQKKLFNRIEAIWNYKINFSSETLLIFFRIILAVVWFISNNAEGIKNYYRGIGYYLKIDNIDNIDEGYTDEEIENELINNNFNLALAKVYENKNGSVLLQSHQQVSVGYNTFTDCGETTLRNFIRVLIQEGNTYNFKILKSLGAIDDVKLYFETYKPFLDNSINKIKFKNKMLSAREAWAYITSKLDNVIYNDNYNKCEISYDTRYKDITSNMLNIIKNLFKNIKTFADFKEILKFEFDYSVNKKQLLLTIKGRKYIWTMSLGHYTFVAGENISEDLFKMIIISKLDNVQKFYLRSMLNAVFYENKLDNILGVDNWFYYIDNSKIETLYELFNIIYNNTLVSLTEYNSFFNYMIENLDIDKYYGERIVINLEKMDLSNIFNRKVYMKLQKKLHSKSLKINQYVIDIKDNNTRVISNLKRIGIEFYDINNNLTIKKNIITELKLKLKLDQPIGGSLNNLTRLESLSFGNKFNQPINGSLNNLTRLESLSFGNNFDQPISGSLNNLTRLKLLSFGNKFNQPINGSLNNLTRLESLSFGNSFDQPIGSLNNLTRLKFLYFGNIFIQDIGDSLNNLTNSGLKIKIRELVNPF